jgi:hypothetical protein
MSDNPNKLKATLLENATTEQQLEFAKMLAEQCASADLQAKGHRCWFFVPTTTEWERMKKYSEPPNYDKCPKCCKGRLRVEVYHGNIGSSWTLKCSQCDFNEYISDDE